jgi:citrate lyase subunit beta / citryl-CoA lyase
VPGPTIRHIRRSVCLVPATVDKYLEKAKDLDADVVFFDLEDSVAPTEEHKHRARENVVRTIRAGGFRAREIAVRVNTPGTNWFVEDVAAVIPAGANTIMIPRNRGLDDILLAERTVRTQSEGLGVELIVLIEAPATLLDLEQIARQSSLVSGLALGPADYGVAMGARLGVSAGSSDYLTYARQKMVVVARAMGWTVTDTVGGDASDPSSVREAMLRSRDLCFDGCNLLYPRLIGLANEVYGVSDEELAKAEKVIELYESNRADDRAAAVVDGRVIVAPIYESALRIRELAKAIASRN